jgi:hypothetical protein
VSFERKGGVTGCEKPIATTTPVVMSSSALLTIPSELLQSIISQLPSSTLSALSRTCKRLRAEVDPALYAFIKIGRYDQLALLLQAIERNPDRASCVKSLRLFGKKGVKPHDDKHTPSALHELFKYNFDKLRDLVIEGNYLREDDQRNTLVENIIRQPVLEASKSCLLVPPPLVLNPQHGSHGLLMVDSIVVGNRRERRLLL